MVVSSIDSSFCHAGKRALIQRSYSLHLNIIIYKYPIIKMNKRKIWENKTYFCVAK